MLTLKGKLINTFVTPKGEKDGKEYGGQDKVQIIGDIQLPNGETKVDMFTLTAHNVSEFKSYIGKEVRVPIGIFAAAKSLTYYIPKGSKLEICS
jgi:hypothetical protein